ncbi:hypothetical protein PTQ27_02880 [Mannheimia sp. AT1]|uniref:Spore protein YkvP/CgeB glycosyl transferase-like domain-containing protein n=1 Tax=Mannheimia cairinae TaxID=3025936 RepID=A0ABT5MMT8_9PAST|nr:hypothetical protein [Mannheimia cairinae]MDD0823415.1 hypothetical protein [Mannheimia cairinae]MDD0826977.1 hypothetical protein [Mannheimia cairinae]
MNYKRIINLVSHLLKKPSLILKGVTSAKKYGIKYALKKALTPYTPNFNRQLEWVNIKEQKQIFILTTRHCYFIARLIQKQLNNLSFQSEIVFDVPQNGFGNGVHFVVCPQMFNELPEQYIAFQLEQSVTSRWFNKEYLNKLSNAYAVLDYSLDNISFLQKNGLSFQKIFFSPLGFYPSFFNHMEENEIYDVLFYGDIKNERRKKYIDKLASKYRVKVIKNSFGNELYQEIAKAKIIVNIHYYDNALLETTRLYECLSLNKLVISEKSADLYLYPQLEETVDFVEEGNIEEMCSRVNFWLKNEQIRKEKVTNNIDYLNASPNLFNFYFLRFMLANDWIEFDVFYDLVSHHIKLEKDFICLGLPETVERRTLFEHQNQYGIQFFSGLRHKFGWVGCGMSYKLLLKKAKESSFPQLTICEDDVLFNKDFYTRYLQVKNFLNQRNDWNIFAGLIADLHPKTEIIYIENKNEEEYIYLDKMTSMVMNIYNQSFYDKLINWNEKDRDVSKNAIDRYIENQGMLRVVTTLPYLVSHREDAYSTLWGINNSVYTEMIKGSEKKLIDKLQNYKQSNEI